MKTNQLAIAALMLCAGAVSAAPVSLSQVDRVNYNVYNAHSSSLRGAEPISLYSDLDAGPDGYVAFPDTDVDSDGALEEAGVADYTSISAGDIALSQFQFVGGVNQANGIVFFDFFTSAGDFIDGFGVQLADEGSFIWTIDLSESIDIASAGLIRMTVDDEDLAGGGSTAAGRWFLGNAGATIGDAGLAEADPDFNYAFALNSNVPTPGTLALLGFGGIAAVRRRR
jgi:hypothetical protein